MRFPALALLVALAAPAASAQVDAGVDRTVVVGGDRSYPPYEFLDKDGNPAGYNVELTRAIARTMGLRVEIRLGEWAAMRRALEAGKLDALQGMSFSEDRARAVEFTPPHTLVHHSIFARRGSPAASSFADLDGKEVLVLRSGIMHALVTHGVPFVLAGSIRDDGPLPGVLSDTLAAQDAMREYTVKATGAIFVATALHAIAVGNMLPAFHTRHGPPAPLMTICVDQTEFVVSKLKDRGTHQAFGVVTNAQDFMHVLRFYADKCRHSAEGCEEAGHPLLYGIVVVSFDLFEADRVHGVIMR